MRQVMFIASAVALFALCACSSLVSERKREIADPHTIAVLPFSGQADVATRALLRNLVSARMADEKVLVFDSAWVDQRLGDGGYLADPADFVFKQAEAASICERLGVEAVLVGDLVATSESSFLVFHSNSIDARLQLFMRDGRRAWMARHGVSKKGGIALESGQIVSALQREFGFHASRERVALGWRLVEEMFASAGGFDAGMITHDEEPRIEAALVREQRAGASEALRIVVEATGPRGMSARFDLEARVLGMPMFEYAPGRYRGIFERSVADRLPAQPAVRVQFSDAYGHRTERSDVSWSE